MPESRSLDLECFSY